MAISKLEKVVLLVHKSQKDKVIETLQDEEIIHITDLKTSPTNKNYPELTSPGEVTDKDLEEKVNSIEKAVNYLKPYAETGSFLDDLIGQKTAITDSTYKEIVSSGEYMELVDRCGEIEKQRVELDRELASLTSQRDQIHPWLPLNLDFEELTSLKEALSVTGVVDRPPKDFEEKMDEAPLDFEVVNEIRSRLYLIVSYLPAYEKEVKRVLGEMGFESVNFEGMKGKPKDILSKIEKRLTEIEKERDKLLQETKELAKSIDKFFTLYDHYSNILTQKRALSCTLFTRDTIYIEGWVRARDYKKFQSIVEGFETVAFAKIEPAPDEVPPVELENRAAFRPFEMLTRLYATPNHRELDPSAMLTPFFVIFFALCLTDAGYGIIVAALSLLFMKRIKGDKSLLWIFFYCGLATLVIGAITGGWFGDLPQRLPLQAWKTLREKVLIFDPMKEPLTFFLLSLGLGFVQVCFGFFVGFLKTAKQGNLRQAISANLVWVFFWVSILIFAFSNFRPSLAAFKMPSAIIAIASILLVLFDSGGKSRSFVIRILKGGFNLYQGLMGTISDILSYSRLMALGLVTVGLAMSMNILAELAGNFPYIGIVLLVVIFIFGHFLSIFINVLGGFVHALRLQYAEFFSKFYDGGGVPFTPFRKEAKYIMVERR
jgi:V/A-type H+-transporting ATPase subunit I